ncbi:MAG: PD-(D/E)XK nuclease family protein [Bryobacteraceae bacterium]|jgi:ATP-dependent helicase/DNAse subunit B
MLLVTGPAGSGKTAFVVDRFREALRTGNDGIRLLAPTATMAQHLQNRIAREGFVFRRRLIQTLSGFVEDWAGDVPQAPDSVLYLMVEEAARRVNRPEFARVAHMPGFCASLARTIAEFSSAGCDSGRLADFAPESPLGAAFLAVYQEVDRELERLGLALRAKRLERAAERIESQGLGGIRAVWLDGFHALPDPELRVIGAVSRHADVTLTLGDNDVSETVRARLRDMGFREERAGRARATPAMALVRAPGIEREAEEIAHRILEQAAGRPFREMGIIVRAAETYLPVLRSTLERFGIPARFYFDSELERHAAVRFLAGAVDAMLGGWDHAQTLKVLRLAPRFADSNAMDRFDFAVREQIPNAGLGALKALLVGADGQPHTPEAERLMRKIDALAAIEEWRSFVLAPKDWAAQFRTLRNLFRAARPGDRTDHELALLWRSQAAVLGLLDEALEEAALALGNESAVRIGDFWRAVRSVLRLKPLRLADGRRNVVHVLSAEEAREWVLPVVFVCGMVEKQFPRFHGQDPFFPDAARCRLNAAGIRVRTAAEFEQEERALFESAISRATMLVTLSYPEFDARGDRNLPSLYLEGLQLASEESRAVRPEPHELGCPLGPPRGPAEIRAPGLLELLNAKTGRLSPTDLESYLQCPFRYFGGRMLRLKAAPLRPEERLDFLTLGSIVHEVLAAWWVEPRDVAGLFESVFERYLEEKRIPSGYHTERLRNAMLDDLRAFASDGRWPRGGFQSRMEERFVFALDESLEISGKIDRLDTAPDGRAYVIDYKYSNAQSTKDKLKDESLLQAPLYLMAAEKVFRVKAAGMFYVGLKGGVQYAGWSESGLMNGVPFPENWLERKKEQTLGVVAEIRAGRVEAAPADPDKCGYCDYRDVCRVEAGRAEALAEGA